MTWRPAGAAADRPAVVLPQPRPPRMNGLIRFSLGNPRAITVLALTILLAGAVSLGTIPADILPVYRSPAVQVLTFYGGMSATAIESGITARMERGTGQAAGIVRQ